MKTPKIHCIFLLVLTLLAFGGGVGAQTVTIGTGTGTQTSTPVYTFNNYSVSEILYLGGEINTTGNITDIAFNKTTGNSNTIPNVTIYMKKVSYSVVSSTATLSGYTQVWSGTFPNTGTGWQSISLTTPFSFTSTSDNLSIMVVNNSGASIDSPRPSWAYTSAASSSTYRSSYWYGSTNTWTTSSSMSRLSNYPNVKLTLASSNGCNVPTGPGASNITSSGATVLWSAPSTGTTPVGYDWEVRTSGAGGSGSTGLHSSASTTAAGLSASVTNLAANTQYTLYVRSSCGSSAYSSWVSYTFTTLCASVSAPYTQNFDSSSSIPGCTLVQNVNVDSYTWAVQTSSTYASSGSNSLRYSYGSSTANDWWFTPGINMVAGTTYKITYAYRAYSSSYPESLEVKTGTAQSAAGMESTALYSNNSITNNTFATATINYVAATTGVQYFGWHVMSTTSGYYLYIDDISITALPNCSTATFPTSVTASASKTNICSGEALTFSLGSGIPAASGITYQWKSSADGVTYTNTGTASTTSTASLTADASNKYFKCDVLCNGSTVLTSTTVEITLGVSITATTPGSRCGQGTIQLGATTQSGNSIKWYTAETSGTLIGTGLTVTTPEIAHTTTYYAAAVGAQTISAAGANNPQTLGSLGSTNNAVETYFTVASATSLTSVTVYPLDAGTNNKIILKNSSGTVLQEYTFTITSAEANSTNSSMGSPKVVALNWDLPAGSYKLQWDNPGGAGVNRVLRNLGGASAYYNTNYSGVTFTGNSGSGTSYWFYFYDWKFTTGCGESATRVPVTATVNYEWTGAADNNWHNPANWCGGVLPGVEDNITFPQSAPPAEIQTGNTGYAKSLALAGATSLNVKTGATLWVANSLSVNEDAALTVQDNAALVQVNTAANNGTITLHKKSNPLYRLDYTLWSSPVEGQSLGGFSPATVAARFYEYKYDEGMEAYWPVATANNFTAAKGYLIRMPNVLAADVTGTTNNGITTPAGYIAGTDNYYFDGVFTGAPHNGTVTYPLSTQGDLYTAVGNPYPSPVNIYDFFYGDIDATTTGVQSNSSVIDVASGIYLWRKRNNSDNPSYATINLSGFIQNPAEGGGSEQADFFSGLNTGWTLAPGQGFLVKAKSGTTNPQLTFTNSMRRAAGGTSQSFFKSAANTASRLWLNITNDTAANQAMVGYFAQATTGIDYGYDAVKFTDPNTIALYSITEATPLAIQARAGFETTDVVPMGFTAPAAGTYTINLDHVDGVFAQGQKIYLRDNSEGILRDLTQQEYTFSTEEGTFENRFEIVYTTEALGTDNPLAEAKNVIVFTEGKTIGISSGNVMMDSVNVFDIRGRKLYTQGNVNNNRLTISSLDATQQVLIVEVHTAKGKVSRRILF